MNPLRDISIVPATPDDVYGIQEVLYQTWLATYPNEEYNILTEDIEERFKDRHNEVAMLKRRHMIARYDPQHPRFVAKHNSLVIGVCSADIHLLINELLVLYVLPEYHGIGLGYALWKTVLALFDPTTSIRLHVALYNTKAILFYQRLGFVATGEVISPRIFAMKNGAVIPELEMVRPPDRK